MHALLKSGSFSRRLGSILLAWTLIAVGLCGCTTGFSQYVHNGFKVGPNYQKPPVPLTKQWIDDKDARVHQGDPNLAAWWDVFDDPVLTALLQRSYSHNLSLKAAAFQVLQAREQRAIALGEIMPQSQSFALSYIHGMTSTNGGSAVGAGSAFGSSLGTSRYLGAGLAGFDPDRRSYPWRRRQHDHDSNQSQRRLQHRQRLRRAAAARVVSSTTSPPMRTCPGNWISGACSVAIWKPPAPASINRWRITTRCWSSCWPMWPRNMSKFAPCRKGSIWPEKMWRCKNR